MNRLSMSIAIVLLIVGLIFGALTVGSFLQYRETSQRADTYIQKADEASRQGETSDRSKWLGSAQSEYQSAKFSKNKAIGFGIISSLAIIIAMVLLVDLLRKR